MASIALLADGHGGREAARRGMLMPSPRKRKARLFGSPLEQYAVGLCYGHRVPLSREFNHRMIVDGMGGEHEYPMEAHETALPPGEHWQRWRRAPHPHELREHNTTEGLAEEPLEPG